jgi:hypothetical protein
VAFPITGQAGTLVREVRNNSGATITKGTVVYINGASGNRPTIAKAIATTDATSAQTFGLVQADISNNSNGYIVAFGDLDGLDTSAFTEGAQLYLSSTVLGGYTITKQYAPAHLVYIGVVTRSHVNQGRIEVRIQNGYEIDELHDVAAQTPSNNDGLFYNSTNSLWENKSIATALGYTPANAATTLTINGVTYDLSTSRTWTISTGISGSGTSGQVTYWSGASAVSGSNNLFWDNTNGRLGIGTNAPAYKLDIRANSNGVEGFFISNSNTGTGAATSFSFGQTPAASPYNAMYIINYGSGWTGGGGAASSNRLTSGAGSTGGFDIVVDALNAPFRLFTNNGTTSQRLQVFASGNLAIGGTFASDFGTRLQVYGDTLLRGSGASSTTTALTVQNSSSTNLFTVRNDGRVGINTNAPATTFDIRGASAGIFLIRDSPEEGFIRIQTGDPTNNNGIAFRGLSNQKGFRFCDPVTSANNYMQLWASGNLTIETNTTASYSDVASALLQVNSTTKGFLPPRMTTTQKNAIATPSAGLVVYDTTDNKHYGYNGTTWNAFY